MRRRGVEVEVILFDVLAVVSFVAAQAEEALLQDGIAAIPKGEREAEALVIVADSEDAVLRPPEGAQGGLIEGEIIPGVAIGAVVFAGIAPGAFGQIRPPAPPVFGAIDSFDNAVAFGGHIRLSEHTATARGNAEDRFTIWR